MIKVQNLTKYYGTKKAISSLNFELKKGEIVGLLGLNGSGKTTTIRILSSYLIPSEGEGYIDGLNIFQNPIEVKKKIGYLPESPPLYKDLNVYEYLQFVARIKGLDTSRIKQEIESVSLKTGISEKKENLISHLSLGFRKRVGIAQAMIGNPSVIILDEPVSGLDPKQIIEMRNMIRSLSGNSTVLISSHILSEIQKICDRFLFLKDGELVHDFSRHRLEEELNLLSGLNIILEGKSKEDCETLIRTNLSNTDKLFFEGEDFKGFSFFVQAKEEENFKNSFIQRLSDSGIHLHSLKKQEITLEDFFNRVN